MSTLMGSKLATQKMRAIASSTTAGTSVKSPSIVRPKTSTSATIRTDGDHVEARGDVGRALAALEVLRAVVLAHEGRGGQTKALMKQ